MRIITWNLGQGFRGSSSDTIWDYIKSELKPDILLSQETKLPQNLPDYPYHLLDNIGGSRNWGSGIFSKHPINKLDFPNSYPGAVVAGDIKLTNDEILTVISIHAILENGYSIIPLHRILSDLTLILEEKGGNRKVILGGDFNASIQFDKYYSTGKIGSHKILFDRIENFGLINCLQTYFEFPVQTYRPKRGNRPWQIDYLFVNETLRNRLSSCKVLENTEIHHLCDHNPIVLEFSKTPSCVRTSHLALAMR